MLMEAIRPQLVSISSPRCLRSFRPVVYRPLSAEALAQIVRMKLGKVAQRIEKRFAVRSLRRCARRRTRACVPVAGLGRAQH